MAIALTSIDASVSFGFETTTTAGSVTSIAFTKIPMVTEIPEMNPTPDMLDTTSLDNHEYTTGVPGLKSLDVLTFTARFSQDLYNMYDTTSQTSTLWGGYQTAKKSNLGMWLKISISGLGHSCYIQVEPSPLGLPAVSANSVIDVSLYFTPVGEPKWLKNPTTSQ